MILLFPLDSTRKPIFCLLNKEKKIIDSIWNIVSPPRNLHNYFFLIVCNPISSMLILYANIFIITVTMLDNCKPINTLLKFSSPWRGENKLKVNFQHAQYAEFGKESELLMFLYWYGTLTYDGGWAAETKELLDWGLNSIQLELDQLGLIRVDYLLVQQRWVLLLLILQQASYAHTQAVWNIESC